MKRHFQCAADPTMIRAWSEHETVSPQPASQPRWPFTPTTSILYWKIQHFALRLSLLVYSGYPGYPGLLLSCLALVLRFIQSCLTNNKVWDDAVHVLVLRIFSHECLTNNKVWDDAVPVQVGYLFISHECLATLCEFEFCWGDPSETQPHLWVRPRPCHSIESHTHRHTHCSFILGQPVCVSVRASDPG